MNTRVVPIAAALVAMATSVLSQGLTEALDAAFLIEQRLLEAELDRYTDARRMEREAFREMDEAVRRLDEALADRGIAIQELRELDSAATLAREEAFARSAQVGEIRRSLFERMDRIAELSDELQKERRRALVDRPQLDGMWRIEIEPLDLSGIVRMSTVGTLVFGTYRLSSGAQGSLRGLLVDNRLTLERIDFRTGFDATLTGNFDPAAGEIRGDWTAVDVSGGAQTSGAWRARKLSPEEEREMGLR